MRKLKVLFNFVKTQLEKAKVSPKYSGLASIVLTLVLAVVLVKLALVAW